MLPISAHTRMPWRIHAFTKDFRVEDVWALPTPGGHDDFPRLLELMARFDPSASSPAVNALFSVRRRLGEWLGLDRALQGVGSRVPSLHERLPADLRGDVGVTMPEGSPFAPLYSTHREAAFEIANKTVHGVLHLGWRPDGDGGYRGQLAVLVKPNGRFGRAYVAAIAPIRYAVVYPLLLRSIAALWREHTVHQVEVPDEICALSTLPSVDYADAFLVDVSAHPDWAAEQWAAAVLEGAPVTTRDQLQAGWSALGLRRARSTSSVAGWAIRKRTRETFLLGRTSRLGMPGELVFVLRPDGLVFATFVHYDSGAARKLWSAAQRAHVRTVLTLLDRAARDLKASAPAMD
jgi:hypothetical protein